jgi:hypothetical protein
MEEKAAKKAEKPAKKAEEAEEKHPITKFLPEEKATIKAETATKKAKEEADANAYKLWCNTPSNFMKKNGDVCTIEDVNELCKPINEYKKIRCQTQTQKCSSSSPCEECTIKRRNWQTSKLPSKNTGDNLRRWVKNGYTLKPSYYGQIIEYFGLH